MLTEIVNYLCKEQIYTPKKTLPAIPARPVLLGRKR